MSVAGVSDRQVDDHAVEGGHEVSGFGPAGDTHFPDAHVGDTPGVFGFVVADIGQELAVRGELGAGFGPGRGRDFFLLAAPEGNNKEVDKMVEICKKGPEHAVIKKVDIIEESFQSLKDFKILRR